MGDGEDMLLGFRTSLDGGAKAPEKSPGAGRAPVTLDVRDLTTHAVCLGATGSGKTGLCIDLIEEASLQGVPVLAVDVKGDLTNLALVFPELNPNDFEPWIEPEAAQRQGVTTRALAEKVAASWRAGLEADGIDIARRRRLRDARAIRLYTPGSDAGQPVNVVESLAVPEPHLLSSEETLGEAVSGAAGALLGLLGIDFEPLRSREHVLLANVIQNAWRSGRGLSLEQLVSETVTPSFARVGVFEVDRFMPRAAREELALKLNALIASPGFALWTRGTALSVPQLLGGAAGGRTPLAIVYLAHLGERERMFALALLLSSVVRWMRGQAGTGDLRLLLYVDEVFGFMPPHPHDPPSKLPLLTLLKQARAFGVGVVLATQNPVDLDYKALSNASTWLLGRLATEPDRARVLEALAGAGGDARTLAPQLAALEPRQFLLHRAGQPPVAFRSRFAMSYLRGPLMRVELARLVDKGLVMGPAEGVGAPASAAAAAPSTEERTRTAASMSSLGSPVRPSLPPGVSERFVTPGTAAHAAVAAVHPALAPAAPGERLLFGPLIAARVNLRFDDVRLKLDQMQSYATIGSLDAAGNVTWTESPVALDLAALETHAPEGTHYMPLPAGLATPAGWRRLESTLTAKLLAGKTQTLYRAQALGLVSAPGETREAFLARTEQAAEARAAEELAELREGYATRLARLEERIARATAREAGERAELSGRKREEILSAGESVLGFLFGRRSVGALSTASRRRRMSETAAHRVDRTAGEIERLKEEMAKLNDEIEDKAAELESASADLGRAVEEVVVGLERDDVRVEELGLLWCAAPPL